MQTKDLRGSAKLIGQYKMFCYKCAGNGEMIEIPATEKIYPATVFRLNDKNKEVRILTYSVKCPECGEYNRVDLALQRGGLEVQ